MAFALSGPSGTWKCKSIGDFHLKVLPAGHWCRKRVNISEGVVWFPVVVTLLLLPDT